MCSFTEVPEKIFSIHKRNLNGTLTELFSELKGTCIIFYIILRLELSFISKLGNLFNRK